jgi:hypothetical protein
MSSHIRNRLNKQKYNQFRILDATTSLYKTGFNKLSKDDFVDHSYDLNNPSLDRNKSVEYKRNPLNVNRKSLACCDTEIVNGVEKMTHNRTTIINDIYRDTYTNCTSCQVKSKSNRSNQPIIRSGMQPIKGSNYSFSYRDYMKNKKNITYERKQTTFNKKTNNIWTSGTGNCDDNCNDKTTWKPNNDKFKVQGSVSSSSRLDRLKLDTIRSSSRCDKDPTKCNGVYFAGKPRFTGWIYNDSHEEKCCPQEKARRRTMAMRKDNKKYNGKTKHQFNSMNQVRKQKICCQPSSKKK